MTINIAGAGGVVTPRAEAQAKASDKSRLLYIDNMRVWLIILVIVGHMAITYGAPTGDWYYREEGEVSALFDIITLLLLGIGASFLLGLFYLIAGYFTPSPYDRKGPGAFILDRLIRLGIPAAVYALIINPLVTYWAAVHGGYVGSFWQYVPTHLPDLTQAAVGPLWFVEGLLLFSIGYALIRLAAGKKFGDSAARQTVAPVPGNRAIFLFALGLGLVTFITRIWAPAGWWWEPPHLEPGHFPQYIALFAVGILACRHDWLTRLNPAQARIWGWCALVCAPLLPALAIAAGALTGEFDPAVAGGFTWLSLAYSLWEAFMGVAMVIVTLVWFRRRFNQQGSLLRRMTTAAYAVYVLHPLVIVPLALSLSRVQLGLGLKFLLFAPLAVVLCFAVGYLVKQLRVAGKIL